MFYKNYIAKKINKDKLVYIATDLVRKLPLFNRGFIDHLKTITIIL